MTVQLASAMNPTAWGYQAGNLSVGNAQTQYESLDIVDKAAIGARGLVGGISASGALLRTAKASVARAAEEGGSPMSTAGMMGRSIGATVGRSMLVGSLISVGTNLYHAITGKIAPSRAAGNVVADSVGTATGALAATAAAGLVAGAIGAPGILMAGATFLAGTAAFVGVDALLHVSGIHQGISDRATDLVEQIIEHFRRRSGPGGV